MLPSQRALFDMPREICYLNAAAWGPLPLAAQEAGRAAVMRKARPWQLPAEFATSQHERARRAAARLINADPDDVAIISSVSYGVAIAGRALQIAPGSRVLVLQDDHSSPVLEWIGRAEGGRFTVEAIARPAGADWTEAVLAAIARPGAAPVALASLSSIHWADGGFLDLHAIADALRRQGAALLVDATHHAGVLPLDVRLLDPDFLLFPTYKWTLGPYGRAFAYIAKRRQDSIPLEQTSAGRRGVGAESVPYMRDVSYVPSARRFDMGERDHFISLEMAAIGMELVADWGAASIAARLAMLTGRLAEQLSAFPVTILPQRARAPNLLSLGFPAGMPRSLPARLESESVFAAPRLGRLRISPHVYNDEADLDRFVEVFQRAMR